MSEQDESSDGTLCPEPLPGGVLRVGIVGAGRGGRALLEVFHAMPDVRIAGICDLDPHAMGLARARELGIPIHENAEDLLAHHPVDWLINVSHGSITQRLLIAREFSGVRVLDGAAAELAWRILHTVESLPALCQDLSDAGCRKKLGFQLLRQIFDAGREIQGQLTGIALHDPLTGLYTRRMLMEFLQRESRHSKREGVSLSLLLVDVDHFKSVNDIFGHQAGDDLLRQLSEILQQSHRPRDMVSRYGGEEFITALPETPREQVLLIAERLRRRVRETLRRPDGVALTISAGVATWDPQRHFDSDPTPELLITQADQALYRAKRSGRDRVYSYDPHLDRTDLARIVQ